MSLNPSAYLSHRSSNAAVGFLTPSVNSVTTQAHFLCQAHNQAVQYVCTYKSCNNRLLCNECYPFHPESHKTSISTYKEVFGPNILDEIEEEISSNANTDQKKELYTIFLNQLQASVIEIRKRIEKTLESIYYKVKEKVLSQVSEPLFSTTDWEGFKKSLVEKKNLLMKSNGEDLMKYMDEYLRVYTLVGIALTDSDNARSVMKTQDVTEIDDPISLDPEIVDETIVNVRSILQKFYSKLSLQISPSNTPADNIEGAKNTTKHYKSASLAFHLSPFYTKPPKELNNSVRYPSNASLMVPNKDKSADKLGSGRVNSEIPYRASDLDEAFGKKSPPFTYDVYVETEILDLPYVGPLKLGDGSVYKGQMKDGKPFGKGKQIWKDGKMYEGYYRNGCMEGKGRMTHPDQDVYEGQWVNGLAHGKGKYKRTDGWEYEGDWQNDQPHGRGVEIWPDGSRFEGEYKRGLKEGRGFLKCADGSWYRGTFRENMFDGEGIYVWADGRKYEGNWLKGMREGQGVMTFPDGRKYVGAFLSDKRNGFGIFDWKDGRKYMGHWRDGKPHGQGKLHSMNGGLVEGDWRDGRLGPNIAISIKELKTKREETVGKSVDLLSDLSRQSGEKTSFRGFESPGGANNYSVKSVVDADKKRETRAKTLMRPDLRLALKGADDNGTAYNGMNKKKEESKNNTIYQVMSPDDKGKNQSYKIQIFEKNGSK